VRSRKSFFFFLLLFLSRAAVTHVSLSLRISKPKKSSLSSLSLLDPPPSSSSPSRPSYSSSGRAAADFLWGEPLPEAPAAEDERRRWGLARSGQACVLRGAPLAAELIASSSKLFSLEAVAGMEKGEESDGDEEDEEEESDEEEETRPPRPPPPPPPPEIPATLLVAGPHAPPELHALDERKNNAGAHYRIRCPPTAKFSKRLESSEGGGELGEGRRSSGSVLSSLAAAASAWRMRPSLLTARLLTGEASKGDDENELRRAVREWLDWRWLSSLAGNENDNDDDGGSDENGGESSTSPPPPPSCWLPPSAIDCEWAGGGGRTGGCVVILPASYATHDRVFAQVQGTRRVLVAKPGDALEKYDEFFLLLFFFVRFFFHFFYFLRVVFLPCFDCLYWLELIFETLS